MVKKLVLLSFCSAVVLTTPVWADLGNRDDPIPHTTRLRNDFQDDDDDDLEDNQDVVRENDLRVALDHFSLDDARVFTQIIVPAIEPSYPKLIYSVSPDTWNTFLTQVASRVPLLNSVAQQVDFQEAIDFFRSRVPTSEVLLYCTIKFLVPRWINKMEENTYYFDIVEGLAPLTRQLQQIVGQQNPVAFQLVERLSPLTTHLQQVVQPAH